MPSNGRDPLTELRPSNRGSIYAELRERTPVHWSSTHAAWVLTRYADVSAILRHPDAQALDGISFIESLCRRGGLDLSGLLGFLSSVSLFTRPPRHEAVRRLLSQALAGIRQMNLPQMLEGRADRLLASGEREGSIDLANGYGKALALFVIGSFLAIPEEDIPELSGVAGDLLAVFERTLASVSTLIKLNERATFFIDYFSRLIGLRRREPGADGMSLIVRLADEQLGCSDQELAGYCTFFFIAAEETTAAAISGAALHVLQRPALRLQLTNRASLVPQAVRELLRLVSPVQYVSRQLRSDIEISDQLIRAGEPIILMLGSANRDPAAFHDPDEIDLDRKGPESLVFATGPYRCTGAQLATFEVDLALRKLLEKPGLQLSPHPPVWSERMNIAPLVHLPAYFVY